MDFSRVIAKLNRIPDEFQGMHAEAGWLESSQYEDGTKAAYVAAIQEYGAPEKNIPPRPFMRPAVEQNRDYLIDGMKQGVKAVLARKASAEDVLSVVGSRMAGDISKAISQVSAPPLKPATIATRARKRASGVVTAGLTKPLVDTGYMLATVTSQVVKDADN